MFLPIRTNIWPRRTPYANYALIALTWSYSFSPMAAPIGTRLPASSSFCRFGPGGPLAAPARRNGQYHQFLTYAFLHNGLLHIVGNMFFLYLFGNNINDKFGHLWYIVFYLAGAVFSGVGHTLVNLSSYAPTLGASGAVAAVTGAYLVLYPQTLITVLYWFSSSAPAFGSRRCILSASR